MKPREHPNSSRRLAAQHSSPSDASKILVLPREDVSRGVYHGLLSVINVSYSVFLGE